MELFIIQKLSLKCNVIATPILEDALVRADQPLA